MGDEDYLDPGSISEDLQCPICCSPFVNPHSLPCGHTYCLRCLSRLRDKEGQLQCPMCKAKTAWAEVRKSDIALRSMVDALVVRCPNRGHGCSQNMSRGDVAVHVAKYCEVAIVECPIKGCSHQVRRRDLGAHTATCSHRIVTCPLCSDAMTATKFEVTHPTECSHNVKATKCPHCSSSFDSHAAMCKHEATCSAKPLLCPHSVHGCSFRAPASALESHLSTCPFELMQEFIKNVKEEQKAQTQRMNEQAKELAELKTALEQEREERRTQPQLWAEQLPAAGQDDDTDDISKKMGRPGTLVEFQWFVQGLKKPRGSLISPNFTFADLEWQLSIDGSDSGIYLAANGRGVTATYMISVVEGDLSQTKKRNWVSMGCQEFGVSKWGCPGIMYCYYNKTIVVTVAFTHVISPINIVSEDNNWVVGVDSHYGTASSHPPKN